VISDAFSHFMDIQNPGTRGPKPGKRGSPTSALPWGEGREGRLVRPGFGLRIPGFGSS